jgi:hypothetical protein
MKRHVARIGCVGALAALSWLGCGGRTGALDGFGDSGSAGGRTGGESGSTASSGSAASSGSGEAVGASTGTVTFSGSVASSGFGSTGTVAFSGSVASSGTVAFSGSVASSGTVAFSGSVASSSGTVSDSIPPAVASGCDTLCAREAMAMCPNQGTIASCVLGCRLLLNNPSCAMQSKELFACEQTSPVSCDASGKATLDACGVQTLVSAACFLQSDTDPTLQGPCTTYCMESAAAHCPGDDPSGCESGCQVAGNLIPSCDPLWKGYVTCAASGAPLSCGSDGKAWAPACAVQAIEYLACTAQGATTVADAGL